MKVDGFPALQPPIQQPHELLVANDLPHVLGLVGIGPQLRPRAAARRIGPYRGTRRCRRRRSGSGSGW